MPTRMSLSRHLPTELACDVVCGWKERGFRSLDPWHQICLSGSLVASWSWFRGIGLVDHGSVDTVRVDA